MSDNLRRPPGSAPASVTPRARVTQMVVIALVAVVILVAFMSCVSSLDSESDSDSTTSVPSKYVQTWEKNYSDTTCSEWNRAMTTSQQFAAAADMLASARNKIDGGTGLPPDSLIDEFASGVSTACVVPTSSLAEIGAGLYLTEPRFAP